MKKGLEGHEGILFYHLGLFDMGVSWHQFLPWEITDLKNKLFYVLGFLSSARRSPSLCSFLCVWFIQTSGSDWFENPWFWLFQRWPFIIFILLPHCIQDLFDVSYAYFNVELYVFSFAWQNLLNAYSICVEAMSLSKGVHGTPFEYYLSTFLQWLSSHSCCHPIL